MRRVARALVTIALLLATACIADDDRSGSSGEPKPEASTPSVSLVWSASESMRPDWVGRSAPWAWEHGDDVVVLAPQALVALDLKTGAESWNLPLGGEICGAAKSPSPAGLVAVIVGECEPEEYATRAGGMCCTGQPAIARHTTVKVVDLASASVVWEREFARSPVLDIGGEVLLTMEECQVRRWDLASGTELGDIGTGCEDAVLVGQGVAIVTSPGFEGNYGPETTVDWRVVEVATGSDLAATTSPGDIVPLRVLSTDPVTVLAFSTLLGDLFRMDGDGVRLLMKDEPGPADGSFAALVDDTLIFRHSVYGDKDVTSALAEVPLHDGSPVRDLPYTAAEGWIPVGVVDGSVVVVDGSLELDGLSAGHARVTSVALADGEVTVLGDVGGETLIGDTNYQVAAPMAVMIGDLLLMPGHGNQGVLAYRLTLPAAG